MLEATAIGQLEFCCGAIWLFFLLLISPAAGAVEMWESGAPVFCRISKPGGKSGKLVFAFGVFHAFHGASFPRRKSSVLFGAQRRRFSLLSGAFLAHRFSLHFDPMSVVHQPVQDAIGQGRIADLACHCASGSWLVKTRERIW